MKLLVKALLVVLLSSPAWVLAVVEGFEFETDQQRERYHRFIDELRCPKCQNQNLSGSDAQIAKDLRNKLHELIMQEKSDEEIVDYMVQRYGNFVLYEPPVDKNTLWLWLAPTIFLFIGAIVVLVFVFVKKPGSEKRVTGSGLTVAEQESLQRLLDKHKND